MNPRRVAAVARRIAEGFRRDHRSLALLVVAPLVIVALLGWVLRDQKSSVVDLAVVNEAGAIGTHITDALTLATANAPDGVSFVETDDSEAVARDRIRSGQIDLALVLPSTLATDVAAGHQPTLTVITAGTDPAAESGAFASLQSVMGTLASTIAPPGSAPIIPKVEHQTVYLSPDADQVDVLAPVFLGLFAYFFVFILTGISFLRERVGGTLERLLATPVTRAEIVLGYSIGFTVFATLQVLILTAYILAKIDVPSIGPIGAFTIGLNVQSAGSPAIAFLVAFLMAFGAVNLGIFLSTFARTELQIVQFIPIVILPQGLLGGIFWPIDRLPDVLQAVAHVLPVTYAVDALREVMLKGADLGASAVQTDLLVLVGIAVLFVLLGAFTIKREVA